MRRGDGVHRHGRGPASRSDPAPGPIELDLVWIGGSRFVVAGRGEARREASGDDRRAATGASGAPLEDDRPPAAAWAGSLPLTVDGDGASGLSPMETLLAALGSCGGVDVVDILRKGRQDVRALSIRVRGERRAEIPRRFVRVHVEVRVAGAVDREKAERAAKLAFGKYCSVAASLDPEMPILTGAIVDEGDT